MVALGLGRVELQWDAPPQCPDSGMVESRLAGYLGGLEQDGEPVRARASVRRVEAGIWELRLDIRAGGRIHERTITNDACDGLAETTALLVAIAVAPELANLSDLPQGELAHTGAPLPMAGSDSAVSVPVPAEVHVAVATEDAVEPAPRWDSLTPAADRPAEPSRPRRSGPEVSLRARGGVDFRLMPLGADVDLAALLSWRHLRFELLGRYVLPRALELEQIDGRALLSGWALGARACGAFAPTRWLDVPSCAGIEVGQLRGRNAAWDNPGATRGLWAAAVAATSLRFVVHTRVALWVGPELAMTFAEPDFYVGDDLVHRPRIVSGRVLVGIEARIL